MVTSVFMRGSNANRVLVQIDGVPVTDGSVMGSAALLSQLQCDQIDHIEIVRGDISAVYRMRGRGRDDPDVHETRRRQAVGRFVCGIWQS